MRKKDTYIIGVPAVEGLKFSMTQKKLQKESVEALNLREGPFGEVPVGGQRFNDILTGLNSSIVIGFTPSKVRAFFIFILLLLKKLYKIIN